MLIFVQKYIHMLHFISFGSGSSGNCSLLYTEQGGLFIDAGVGIRLLRKYISNYNLPLSAIDSILVTHDHADHVKSVGSLSKSFGLPVYATLDVHRGIEENWCVRQKISPEMKREVKKGLPFACGPFRITAFGIPHDSKDNVGYCLEAEEKVFVLMTDIGHFTPEICQYISKANYLVIEADYEKGMLESGPYPVDLKHRIQSQWGHSSNFECGMALSRYATPNLKRVWLCHLSNTNNRPDMAEATVKRVLRSNGIVAGSEPGADFRIGTLNRKLPSGVFDL